MEFGSLSAFSGSIFGELCACIYDLQVKFGGLSTGCGSIFGSLYVFCWSIFGSIYDLQVNFLEFLFMICRSNSGGPSAGYMLKFEVYLQSTGEFLGFLSTLCS